MSKYRNILLVLLITVFVILLNLIVYRLVTSRTNAEIDFLHSDNLELQLLIEGKQKRIAGLEAQIEELLESPDDFSRGSVFEINGLVEVRSVDPTILVELAYATDQNFTGQVLYNVEICLLRRNTAEKLAAANAEFSRDGYSLKVWDAYRPREVQVIMWEHKPDGVYVADPDVGSNHNRGAAVDVTLVDIYGNELEMPTGFDVFGEQASRNNPGMSEEARNNLDYLTEVMVKHGFSPIQAEWWHFNDSDLSKYDFISITLEDWVNSYFAHIYTANR